MIGLVWFDLMNGWVGLGLYDAPFTPIQHLFSSLRVVIFYIHKHNQHFHF